MVMSGAIASAAEREAHSIRDSLLRYICADLWFHASLIHSSCSSSEMDFLHLAPFAFPCWLAFLREAFVTTSWASAIKRPKGRHGGGEERGEEGGMFYIPGNR